MRIYILLAVLFSPIAARCQVTTSDAELFIAIKETGKYEISVDDESISSRAGRFRFFELEPGNALVTINVAGKQVFRREVSLKAGTRTMASFSTADGFKLNDELPMYADGRYALDNWNGGIVREEERPGGNNRPFFREMRPEEFAGLFNSYKKETFDDGKLRFLQVTLRNNRLSVNQLIQLLQRITFDDNRLVAAVNCYPAVYDRGNFFKIRDIFNYRITKDKFDAFLLRQG
ncbi:DUF4476 domain-containing protein [Hufsiella ginkgonis]|uniref:DUF4476 domain-containing protein n=1 Tax=Hufsiella ginkgonis TaxID=2695274 RepID=A0A7K1XUU3_9SPHI|nr:DUF4476 domain-containing protein [Hufsiella ginkgonis]MXV14754.1 DUF4476 domain-containing protein [Hufsiella ginkgonis]